MKLIEEYTITEAIRYLDNAKEILSEKAKKNDGFYSDRKYVRMAGNTAWNGVLIAMDAAYGVKKKLKDTERPDYPDYQKVINREKNSIANAFAAAYEHCHKFMGYDGVLSYKTVNNGLEYAKEVIDFCENKAKQKAKK